ncbi:glycoside hydrolase [Cystobacter fuscus]|uniref:discoidin domain-containing protein n=1 Tax=Cystobacter fuscus TaxID=43 RepID=UPI002B28E664|nr:glycoside hydrolase [Cystobacter fuscus]
MNLLNPFLHGARGAWSRWASACASLVLAGMTAAWPIAAHAQTNTNLARGKPVTVSSTDGVFSGSSAVDGDPGTRWSSGFTDNEWISIDLGSTVSIGRVVLNWETAYGKNYTLESSTDGANWTALKTVTNGDGGIDDWTVSGSGRYVRMRGQLRAIGYGYSLWEFEVYGSGGTSTSTDLARGRSATATSIENNDPNLGPSFAFDGNANTRWSSVAGVDPQSIRVDLGSSQQVGRVVLNWEGAYAKTYTIDGSNDDANWQTLATITDGAVGIREIPVSGTYRYVRMRGTARGTGYGYSLYSFEVYQSGGTTPPPTQTTNQTVKLVFPDLAYAKVSISPTPLAVSPVPEEGLATPSVRNPAKVVTYLCTFPPNTTVTMSKNQFSPTQPNTDIRLVVTDSTGTTQRAQTVSALAVQDAVWQVEIYSTGSTDPGTPSGPIIPDPYVKVAPPATTGSFAVTAPANGAMITNTRRPTFQWAAVTGATNYKLFVNISRNDYDWMASGDLLNRFTEVGSTTGTSLTLNQDLVDRWTYKWYVVATLASGATSRSDLRTFSVYLPVVETVADGVSLINGMRDMNKNGVIDPYEDWHNPIATRVNDLMSRMTRHQKVMQLFFNAKQYPDAGFTMGPLAPEDIVAFQKASAATPLGIPYIDAGDSIHGFKTSWPTQPGLVATRDPQLAYEMGDIQRREQLAVGSRGTLSPLAEVGTKILYPRIQEGSGEDADVAAGFSRALIAGLQGGPEVNPHSIWVTTKHWPSQGAGGEGGITYDGTTIHYHMRPWHAALEAGTSGIMPGYAGSKLLAPGQWGAGDSPGIINYLRQNMGYTGVICTDWLPAGDPWVRSLMAGSDVMGGADPGQMGDFESRVTDARVEESARRVIELKFRLGLFEDPYRKGLAGTAEWHTASNKNAARLAAQESMTLLKNDGALPLRMGAGSSIVIAGPRADDPSCMVTWRSDFHNTDFGALTIYQAIKQRAEAAGITVYKDAAPAGVTPSAAIVAVGESYFTHGTAWDKEKPYIPGDPAGPAHTAFSKPEEPRDHYGIITSFKSKNIPTITVMVLPRPYILTNVAPQSNALVAIYRPGDLGGPALADVLFGDVLPRGKLPWDLPRSMDQIGTDVETDQKERWDLPFDLGATEAERTAIRDRIAKGLSVQPIYGNPFYRYGDGIQGFGLTDSTPPTAFTLQTPANGTTITGTRPAFSWTASSDPQTGIQYYEVVIDGQAVLGGRTKATSAALEGLKLANGQHSWYVRAVNWANGVTTSATSTFTLNDTTPPAAFSALLPAAGSAVPGTSTRFIWERTSDVGAGVAQYVLNVDGTDRTPVITAGAYTATTVNLARGKNVTATSNEFGSANDAVDGNPTTRWSSRADTASPNTESITIDLGAVHSIKRVVLNWEAAYGTKYVVEASLDGTTWTPLYTENAGNGGIDDLTNLSGVGQYVRMRGVQRATAYGYSLWEFEVYGLATHETTLTGLAAGSHTWRVRAVDGANNSTQSNGPISFTK